MQHGWEPAGPREGYNLQSVAQQHGQQPQSGPIQLQPDGVQQFDEITSASSHVRRINEREQGEVIDATHPSLSLLSASTSPAIRHTMLSHGPATHGAIRLTGAMMRPPRTRIPGRLAHRIRNKEEEKKKKTAPLFISGKMRSQLKHMRTPQNCVAYFHQPGLLCTPRNFAQSSKFLGKIYFLVLRLPLSHFQAFPRT
jgi:hypothetical protein